MTRFCRYRCIKLSATCLCIYLPESSDVFLLSRCPAAVWAHVSGGRGRGIVLLHSPHHQVSAAVQEPDATECLTIVDMTYTLLVVS